MNLRNLRYFLMVAEEKNMTKAARKLFISQQTLSGVIRRLEEEYHTRLFEREPCMHLTEAGFYMEKFARQVLKMETTLTNQLDEISHELRGHLTISHLHEPDYYCLSFCRFSVAIILRLNFLFL